MALVKTVPLSFEGLAQDDQAPLRQLLVAGPSLFASFPLPSSGVIEIGRSETAGLRLDDPGISRRHATIHVTSEGVFVEDDGSINGTFVRGEQLAKGERAQLHSGDAAQVGSTLLVLQKRAQSLGPWSSSPHTYFEGRLADECRRAAVANLPFCLLRVAIGETAVPVDVATVLRPVLNWSDALALYGPGDWEILLSSRAEDLLDDSIESVVQALDDAGLASDIVVARYPDQGRTADALMAAAHDRATGRTPHAQGGAGVILENRAMRALADVAKRVAASDISVLITGETGVGKDLLARSIHAQSPRKDRSFMSINCSALSETLLESELFGHERGAFTGASGTRIGLLEAASGGTVFLDEVGEMSVGLQAKLLRVLENREIMRVGSVEIRAVDVRFVAATNRDLETEAKADRFRRDLYYRLAGISMTIPPLRERRDEILPLASKFLADACGRTNRLPVPKVSPEAATLLHDYEWPGNIRELRNVVERALVLCSGGEIQTVHLPVDKMRAIEKVIRQPRPRPGPLDQDDERRLIADALAATAGNQTRAARLVGMPRKTFVRRLEAYGFARPQKET